LRHPELVIPDLLLCRQQFGTKLGRGGLESAPGERRHRGGPLHEPASRKRHQCSAVCTIFPRKIVSWHLRSFSASAGIVSMSRSQTAMSASLPTSIEPIRSSRNVWCAAQMVYERSAYLMLTLSVVPNGVAPNVPFSVLRVTDDQRPYRAGYGVTL